MKDPEQTPQGALTPRDVTIKEHRHVYRSLRIDNEHWVSLLRVVSDKSGDDDWRRPNIEILTVVYLDDLPMWLELLERARKLWQERFGSEADKGAAP